MSTRKLIVSGIGLVACSTIAFTQDAKPKASADKPAKVEQKAKPAKAQPVAAQPNAAQTGPAGLIITVDPVTKETRPPTPAEMQALTGSGSSVTVGVPSEPQLFTTSTGVPGAVLPASSMNYMVVSKGPDGKLVMDCVTGDDAAKKALQTPAKPSTGMTMTKKEQASDK